jgi:uncharacterized protein (DUF1697 family)
MVAKTAYAAMLRGINVGGNRKLPMNELRALCAELGLEGARTYIQSGNVVFESAKKPDALGKALEKAIHESHGLEVPVTLRTRDELASLISRNPFVKQGRPSGELHVSFLSAAPTREHLAELDKRRADPDQYAADGTHLYLWCPAGYGNASLVNPVVERVLKVSSTTRNWKTVTTLFAMASGEE